MTSPVRILLLEDSPTDADLTLSRLQRDGLVFEAVRVQTRADFEAAVRRGGFHLILADFVMPGFDGLSALAIARELAPHVPFIFNSGAPGEDRAIESLVRGATDYVPKRRPERLVLAVRRALGEAAVRAGHRRASAALEESRARARLALMAGRMGLWEVDLESGRLDWPDDTATIFRTPARELGGTVQGLLSRVHPEDRDRIAALVDRAVKHPGEFATEFRVQTRGGSYLWLSVRGRAFPSLEGRPARVLGVAADVTRRRRSEEHLRQVQRMEALGRLAGGMAHEANNQMAVVLGFADFVLGRSDLPPELRSDVEQIRRAAERTATVTQQLLTFSRRGASRPEILDLNEVIEAFEPVLRRTLGERSDVVLRLGPPKRVRIGRGQLEQVLLNLVLNAADAMPQGGQVTVETRGLSLPDREEPWPSWLVAADGPYALIAVRDTGVGMDQPTVERIFEPFFTTKEIGRGTGLGLAAVYGIVKQARGYVWADSRPNEGTTMRVYLPVTTSRTTSAVEKSGRTRGSEGILVVEDQLEMRETVQRALAEEGYLVTTAADGRAALAILAEADGTIDLVLSDLAMPTLDGRSVGEGIARLRPDLPVLFMSGYSEDEAARLELLEPGYPFIQKPFAPKDLARRVRAVLDQRLVRRSGP